MMEFSLCAIIIQTISGTKTGLANHTALSTNDILVMKLCPAKNET